MMDFIKNLRNRQKKQFVTNKIKDFIKASNFPS